MVAEDAQILLEILLDPSGEILLAVFEKYNKSKFQVVRNTARSFWRNTVRLVWSVPERRSLSPLPLQWKIPECPQMVGKIAPACPRNIRKCSTINLVGGWERATIPTSSLAGRRATEWQSATAAVFVLLYHIHISRFL